MTRPSQSISKVQLRVLLQNFDFLPLLGQGFGQFR